jgi:HEAT repeat protein
MRPELPAAALLLALAGLATAQPAPTALAVPPAGTPPAAQPQPPAAQPQPQPPAAQPQPRPAAPTAVAPPPVEPKWPDKVGGHDLRGWLQLLKDSPDGQVREAAVKAIPLFGPSARKDALKPLIAATRDTDTGVKVNAILTLGGIGATDEKEVKEIADALAAAVNSGGGGGPVRLHAARSLAAYGPAAASAIGALKGIASDVSWETRAAVAAALGSIGRAPDDKKGPSKAALDTLAARLKEEKSAAVRLEITQSLLALGPPHYKPDSPADYIAAIKPYLDAVTDRLKVEKDRTVLVWLEMVAMTYDGQRVNEDNIRRLSRYALDPDPVVRVAGLRALALLRERAAPALPNIVDALRTDDLLTQVEAIAALAALEKTAAAAVPELEKVKKGHKEPAVREMAGVAIDKILGRKPAVPAAPPPAGAPPAAPPPMMK